MGLHNLKKLITMAQQVGVIKYKGTIGDIRHFKIKGLHGDYAGLNPNFTIYT